MEYALLILVASLFVILLGFWVAAIPVSVHKKLITEELEKKGAKNIHIGWDWKRTSEEIHSYQVSYQDRHGRSHNRICKVTFTQDIYWKKDE